MTSPSGGSQYQQVAGAPGTPTGPKITTVFDFTAEALEQVAFWLEQRGLHIPVTQLVGFSQFTPEIATYVSAQEATSSGSYVDLATVGPQLTGLSPGKYLIQFGCTFVNTAGSVPGLYSPSINGAAPTDANGVTGLGSALTRPLNVTLSVAGSNTIKMQYRSDGVNHSDFSGRWLWAIKYANS